MSNVKIYGENVSTFLSDLVTLLLYLKHKNNTHIHSLPLSLSLSISLLPLFVVSFGLYGQCYVGTQSAVAVRVEPANIVQKYRGQQSVTEIEINRKRTNERTSMLRLYLLILILIQYQVPLEFIGLTRK